ncbi:BQ5605_C037g11641 [Microbotryum silenes-dioicae]|uniref:BQ5605_C037g11641 protein n=1 Tax=Microbotryum silenes-dioicae TaxID=796604 RepID=A0A2X0MJQ8_9BASI|nr:BQ5605_C037g11641 [Microbotryum silenes-dioicae]
MLNHWPKAPSNRLDQLRWQRQQQRAFNSDSKHGSRSRSAILIISAPRHWPVIVEG